MRHVYKSIALLMAVILQCTVIAHIGIMGVTPNIVLAAVIAFSLLSGTIIEAGAYGFAAGLLIDLLWGRVFGVHTLFMLYSALASFTAVKTMYKKGMFVAVFVTLVAAVIYETIFYLLNFEIWGEGRLLYALFRIIVPGAAYTATAQMLVYALVSKLPAKSGDKGGRA